MIVVFTVQPRCRSCVRGMISTAADPLPWISRMSSTPVSWRLPPWLPLPWQTACPPWPPSPRVRSITGAGAESTCSIVGGGRGRKACCLPQTRLSPGLGAWTTWPGLLRVRNPYTFASVPSPYMVSWQPLCFLAQIL